MRKQGLRTTREHFRLLYTLLYAMAQSGAKVVDTSRMQLIWCHISTLPPPRSKPHPKPSLYTLECCLDSSRILKEDANATPQTPFSLPSSGQRAARALS
jgi:hypothetical protein